jgi:hypothetical protein
MSTESWTPPLVQYDTLAQLPIGSTSATAKLTLSFTSDRQLKMQWIQSHPENWKLPLASGNLE